MTSRRSTWRDTYKVHPAADVFPMMSDEKLAQLGEDIKLNGLASPITVAEKPVPDENGNRRVNGRGEIYIVDGRNRLDALEMIGTDFISRRRYVPLKVDYKLVGYDDATTYVISANIHRRHLTKQRQADLIVAAHAAAAAENKLTQVESSFVERRTRQKEPAERCSHRRRQGARHQRRHRQASHRQGESDTEAGRLPATEAEVQIQISRFNTHGTNHRRRMATGLHSCVQGRMRDLDAEQEIVIDALREIAGKRLIATGNSQQAAPTLPQDGRSEVPLDDPTPDIGQLVDDFLLGNIPECLDRRRRP